jgi:hypothetical protein
MTLAQRVDRAKKASAAIALANVVCEETDQAIH